MFFAALPLLLGDKAPLSGKHVVVSAGRTVEYIDPIRLITNNASGRMGMAIAREALLAGARVTILTGKTAVPGPPGAALIRCDTAEELLEKSEEVLKSSGVDIYVAAAAVGDWKCREISDTKITTHGAKELTLSLVPTPKILDRVKAISPGTFVVAFRALHGAGEEELHSDAIARMKKADADMIAVNDVSEEGAGFETETNRLRLFFRDGKNKQLPMMHKNAAARQLIAEAAARISGN